MTRMVVAATDTDVINLCMYYYCFLPTLAEIWVEKPTVYLPIHDIVNELALKCDTNPSALVKTLLSAYVLSGCDSTSYPYKRGKRTAALTALHLIGKLPNLGNVGSDNLELTEAVVSEARVFFVKLYGRENFQSLDTLRQHLLLLVRQT